MIISLSKYLVIIHRELYHIWATSSFHCWGQGELKFAYGLVMFGDNDAGMVIQSWSPCVWYFDVELHDQLGGMNYYWVSILEVL